MIDGDRATGRPIRWAMVGGGHGSQIGYIHRSAALHPDIAAGVEGVRWVETCVRPADAGGVWIDDQ